MRLLTILLALTLVGCAANRSSAVSYEQLEKMSTQLSNKDCPRIDYYINFAETQLRFKGLTNATPEELNDEDRKYNAQARIMIWSLRIGCNNPGRYK